METNRILAELREERNRIERAISALKAVNSTGHPRVGRPPRAAAIPRRRGRMSAAARRKVSRLMTQRWAQGKMKQAKASKPVRRMSRAAQKKIAAAQRARWAKVKARSASFPEGEVPRSHRCLSLQSLTPGFIRPLSAYQNLRS
jgi:hypothetical protein